jgi:hypothetical protein
MEREELDAIFASGVGDMNALQLVGWVVAERAGVHTRGSTSQRMRRLADTLGIPVPAVPRGGRRSRNGHALPRTRGGAQERAPSRARDAGDRG